VKSDEKNWALEAVYHERLFGVASIRSGVGQDQVPLFVMPFQARAGSSVRLLGEVSDTPPPQPLLLLPLTIGSRQMRALLYSGASDSFVSAEVVRELILQEYPLKRKLTVRVANVEGLYVTRFVQVQAKVGEMPVKLQLRVIQMTIPVVLGYPFLAGRQPHIE